jgi:hypothetical protein
MSSHGRWKRGKWIETFPEPNTVRGITFLDHRDPKRKPACPKAVPVYMLAEVSA